MFCRALFRFRIPMTRTHLVTSRQMSSATAENDHILIDEISDKVVITFNRPKVLNAITKPMAARYLKLIREFENTKSMIINKGTGNKSFSAGGDIHSLAKCDAPQATEMFKIVYTTINLISRFKIPYVSLIDGIAMGGGAGIAIHGKYCVATERTVFAMPEARVGMFPDVASSYFLPRLTGKLGVFLGMTAHHLRGEDLFKVGLATHYCESAKLNDLERALLECKNPDDVGSIIDSFATKSSEEFSLSPYMGKINKCFGQSTVEEIFQCLERDGSEWALNILAGLKRISPLSLKITHRQLTTDAHSSVDEALKMEYRIGSRCMENSDFHEGVRALIIEKDNKPKWNPPTIQEVTDERVAEFFAKLPEEKELKFDA